jgi:beta-propeller uncharacterized protein DUF5122
VVAAACAVTFALVAGAGAEVGSAPDTTTWVTDGPVYAIARSGDRTFIGGEFSFVGPRTGSGVPLAPVGAANAGMPSPTYGSFPEVAGGRVMAVEAGPDGSWYIGGNFTHVGGVARGGLARLVPDTSGRLVLDGGFAAGADGSVHALAIGAIAGKDDHVLYVGGRFDSINGNPAYRNLAALDRRTGAPVLAMTAPDNTVRSIDVLRPGDTGAALPLVFAAGPFTKFGAQAANQLAAIWGVNAGAGLAGSLTAWAPGVFDSGARSVRIGKAVRNATLDRVGVPVYLGGDFGLDTYMFDIQPSDNSISTNTFYDFDSKGTTEFQCVDPGCTASIRTITTSPGGETLYVGGRFTTIFAQTRANLAASNGVTNVFAPTVRTVQAWRPDPNGYIHALDAATGSIYIGGDFTAVLGAHRKALAALSPAGSTAQVQAWDPTASGGIPGRDAGAVTALAASSARIFAGGSFTSVGGSRHENVAALDSTGRPIESWKPSTDGRVNALVVRNDRVYLGGRFDHANGQPRMRLAAVDALGGGALDAQFGPAVESCTGSNCVRSEVSALSLRDGALYVGGAFARLAGTARANAGAVDAGSGAALGWTPNPDGNVYSLLATCGTVYAGGNFGNAGGKGRRRLAALDPQTGAATRWNPSVESGSAVRAIARDADVVYVGGNFAQVGGAPREDLAALDAASGEATGWNPRVPGAGDQVWAVAAPPGTSVVYAGGRFTRAGRADRSNVAALDRAGGDATSWSPTPDAPVRALAADGASLAAGGDFRQVGPLPQHGFASFGLGSTADTGTLRCAAAVKQPAPTKGSSPRVPDAPRRPGHGADKTAPRLTHVRLSHRRFRTARRARLADENGAHVGTKFKYGLSERAVVRYTFKRKTRVRCHSPKWRRACRMWPRGKASIHCRSHRWQRRCYRWERVGSMRDFSEAGPVRRRFEGRVGRRWLRPGKYRVRLRAADLAGNRSPPVWRRFRVVRR